MMMCSVRRHILRCAVLCERIILISDFKKLESNTASQQMQMQTNADQIGEREREREKYELTLDQSSSNYSTDSISAIGQLDEVEK